MRDVGVVIVAAGGGTRLGGDVPKQFREVGGVPLLLRAIRPFMQRPDVAHVAVVLPPAAATDPPAWLAELAGETLTVVPGGAERSDSVAAGLASLPDVCSVVLVHDGARPFPQASVIARVAELARAGTAAVAAVPLSDTVKRVAPGTDPPQVVATVPRSDLWRAQTPQGFPRGVLEEGHRGAEPGAPATDDAALVEAMGAPVALVPDSPRNLKVTVADDLVLAEALAALEAGR